MNLVAFAGGVGGAKLADGLQTVAAERLAVIVNTADDFELHGLAISPDLDTVMYTLGSVANTETGWGIAGDSYQTLQMLGRYGAEDWFRLGDRDLATHILRTQWLRAGQTLTQVTARLARALGVRATILPMTNARVATMVATSEGELAFQEYFVHRRCEPAVEGIRFAGMDNAQPAPEVLSALAQADAIILCPSNPFVSLKPILSLGGVLTSLQRSHLIKVAVSPIVGGEALKGPAAKMFREFGMQPSALAVAQQYAGLLDGFVLDRLDAHEAEDIRKLGMRIWITDTVMRGAADRERLAREIRDWVAGGLYERHSE